MRKGISYLKMSCVIELCNIMLSFHLIGASRAFEIENSSCAKYRKWLAISSAILVALDEKVGLAWQWRRDCSPGPLTLSIVSSRHRAMSWPAAAGWREMAIMASYGGYSLGRPAST